MSDLIGQFPLLNKQGRKIPLTQMKVQVDMKMTADDFSITQHFNMEDTIETVKKYLSGMHLLSAHETLQLRLKGRILRDSEVILEIIDDDKLVLEVERICSALPLTPSRFVTPGYNPENRMIKVYVPSIDKEQYIPLSHCIIVDGKTYMTVESMEHLTPLFTAEPQRAPEVESAVPNVTQNTQRYDYRILFHACKFIFLAILVSMHQSFSRQLIILMVTLLAFLYKTRRFDFIQHFHLPRASFFTRILDFIVSFVSCLIPNSE